MGIKGLGFRVWRVMGLSKWVNNGDNWAYYMSFSFISILTKSP